MTPEVESIVLHIDSPGGQAAGNLETGRAHGLAPG
jgi:hypothetical protein